MFSVCAPLAPYRTFFACAAALLVTAGDVRAEGDSNTVVAVEEDWELVIGTPDFDSQSPQVACVMSPLADAENWYAAFEINHQTWPAYNSGGLHVHIWNGDTPLESPKSNFNGMLAAPGETIRWTQRMELHQGRLAFEIANGESQTWGEFGNNGQLKTSVQTSLENLNQYHPEVSVAQSGVSLAAHRVVRLTLLRLRVVTADGQVYQDNQARVAHQYE